MRTNISGIGMKVSSQMEDKIQAKLAKFDRYFDDETVASVKMTAERDEVQLELTLKIGSRHVARAEASSPEYMIALEHAIDIMEGQIRKHKAKLKRRKHHYVELEPYFQGQPDLPEEEEPELKITKQKRFVIEPMDAEEAVLQMNMLNHNFHLYLSPETGKVCLVYRRKDGNFGLIEPEY